MTTPRRSPRGKVVRRLRMTHQGRIIQDWLDKGPPEAGPGCVFLHRMYRTAYDGRSIVIKREVMCLSDADIEHIRQLPDVFEEGPSR